MHNPVAFADRILCRWSSLPAVDYAAYAAQIDNLIQAVNILGSIFYGPTLGVFLCGFFIKRVTARAVFVALLVGQAVVIATWALSSVGFLWYNVIGCGVVVLVALPMSLIEGRRAEVG